jgi:hypothetical protein
MKPLRTSHWQFTFLLAICLSILFGLTTFNSAFAADEASDSSSATNSDHKPADSKPILQGNVEHSESLPSLDERLRPGEVFSDDLLLKAGTEANNDWYWIPSWYAGKRHAEQALIVSRYDFSTGLTTSPMLHQQQRQDHVSGYQADRNGGIWDFKNIPFIQHVDAGPVLAVLYVKAMNPLMINQSQIVCKYQELSITYDRKTHKIINIVQQEQISTISPVQPNGLRADISVKSFGWDGRPIRAEQSILEAKIVEPFQRIDTLEGKDLRAMFRDYLVANKLGNLVPEDLPN